MNKYHIIRATLESIAYQVHDVLVAMKADSGIDLTSLKVDGGASANNFLMQTQADFIQAPVKRPSCVETTALGAAYLAGLAVGYWKDKEEVKENQEVDRIFTPELDEKTRKTMVRGWEKPCVTPTAGRGSAEKPWPGPNTAEARWGRKTPELMLPAAQKSHVQ